MYNCTRCACRVHLASCFLLSHLSHNLYIACNKLLVRSANSSMYIPWLNTKLSKKVRVATRSGVFYMYRAVRLRSGRQRQYEGNRKEAALQGRHNRSLSTTKLSIRQAMQREWEKSWETAKHGRELFRLGVRPGKATLKAQVETHRVISSVIT